MMAPYLKDIHQTLDSCRKGRDKGGWRLSHREMITFTSYNFYKIVLLDENAPTRVKPVTRLISGLLELQELLDDTTLRQVLVIMTTMAWVGYRMGDSSKKRYGTTMHISIFVMVHGLRLQKKSRRITESFVIS